MLPQVHVRKFRGARLDVLGLMFLDRVSRTPRKLESPRVPNMCWKSRTPIPARQHENTLRRMSRWGCLIRPTTASFAL